MNTAFSPTWQHAVVTGGSGFVGSHLCTALLEAGTEVTCVDDFSTGRVDNIATLLDHPAFTLVKANVTEGIPVDLPTDLVLHLAPPASPADYLRLPLHTMEAGSLGTRHALELAHAHGARFVLASTSEVYGDEAKRFGESLTTAHADNEGTDTGIVRLFNTYGPRMRGHDGRAVPTFVRQALAGEPLTVTGDGQQTRSLCYVDDTVQGVLSAAAHGMRGPVNIGNPGEITMLDLARLVIILTDSESEIRFIERPTDDPALRCPDLTLAHDKLDWEPRVAPVDGLRRTIDWFRAEAEAEARRTAPNPPR